MKKIQILFVAILAVIFLSAPASAKHFWLETGSQSTLEGEVVGQVVFSKTALSEEKARKICTGELKDSKVKILSSNCQGFISGEKYSYIYVIFNELEYSGDDDMDGSRSEKFKSMKLDPDEGGQYALTDEGQG